MTPGVRFFGVAQTDLQVDVAVIGGGIAGLWTLAKLRAAGLHAVLIEPLALGEGQTIASQGIIHGGIKYTLGGTASRASKILAPMPAIWRAALAGSDAEVNLRDARVFSENHLLVTTPGLGARLTGIVAAAAVRTAHKKLSGHDRPGPLRDAPPAADVYAIAEQVVDVPSVLAAFRATYQSWLLAADGPSDVIIGDGGASVRIRAQGRDMHITPGQVVLTAGAGNVPMLAGAGVSAAATASQRRPLHMVMFKGQLPSLFAHWIAAASDRPRLTITTSLARDGLSVWYIGGDLAETGVRRTPAEQIKAARDELREVMPWFDLPPLDAATLMIDRVEGRDPSGQRPDIPIVRRFGRIIACWPTKLAFAPAAAAEIRRSIEISPAATGLVPEDWPRPEIAVPPWDREDLPWS